MSLYLYKNNQQFGPFDESTIVDWLQKGECSPDDLALREGMTEWQPLHTLIAFDSSQAMPVANQPSYSGAPGGNRQASGRYENEVALLDRYEQEVNVAIEHFLDCDPNQRNRTQKQVEHTLELYGRQINSFQAAFPTEDYEWKSHLSTFYVGQATLKAFSVGFFRKSSGRSSSLAMGIATGLIAKQQEKNNAMQALQLLDQALSLEDSPHPRIMKAQVFQALGQKQYALNELNYIIANFQDSSVYLDARQMKDEIENPPKKGMCFVATAAYGSELAPEVVLLTRYRDEILLKSTTGTCFVKFYYKVSPPLACLIARADFLRTIVRNFFLSPILYVLRTKNSIRNRLEEDFYGKDI